MKRLFLALIFVFPLTGLALELKVGDILLQPMDCWACTLIEQQEKSIYSHMGLVIQTSPEIVVVESLNAVRSVTLSNFNSRTEKGQKLGVYRLRNDEAVSFLQSNSKQFFEFFYAHFNGLSYDKDFLWDNFDNNGKEKLYCSEMITKLLSAVVHVEVPTKKMKFDKNRKAWQEYFKGNPPDGLPGNSPADYEKSDLFFKVGEL